MLRYEFTLFDIARCTGIKRETLNDWKVKEYIIPSRTEEITRGVKVYFDFWGLNCIILFRRLLKQGISRKVASEIIKSTQQVGFRSPSDEYKDCEYLLVVRKKNGEMVARFCKTDESVDLSRIHPVDDLDHMYLWNFKDVIKEVRTAIF